MTREKMDEGWVNIGKFIDFQSGKRQLVIYVNTDDLVWRVGIIINL